MGAMDLDDAYVDQLYDADPTETKEWLDSLDAVAGQHGPDRAAYLLRRLLAHGDVAGYRAVIEPCEAFGRAVFEAPTSMVT